MERDLAEQLPVDYLDSMPESNLPVSSRTSLDESERNALACVLWDLVAERAITPLRGARESLLAEFLVHRDRLPDDPLDATGQSAPRRRS